MQVIIARKIKAPVVMYAEATGKRRGGFGGFV